MKRTYEYQNGTIFVSLPSSSDRENLIKATEDFLKKVISEGVNNGNSNTSKDFREKQVLHR